MSFKTRHALRRVLHEIHVETEAEFGRIGDVDLSQRQELYEGALDIVIRARAGNPRDRCADLSVVKTSFKESKPRRCSIGSYAVSAMLHAVLLVGLIVQWTIKTPTGVDQLRHDSVVLLRPLPAKSTRTITSPTLEGRVLSAKQQRPAAGATMTHRIDLRLATIEFDLPVNGQLPLFLERTGGLLGFARGNYSGSLTHLFRIDGSRITLVGSRPRAIGEFFLLQCWPQEPSIASLLQNFREQNGVAKDADVYLVFPASFYRVIQAEIRKTAASRGLGHIGYVRLRFDPQVPVGLHVEAIDEAIGENSPKLGWNR